MDRYPIEDRDLMVLDNLNLFFFSVFLLEMILKLLGLGYKYYFKDRFNAFDCFIVIISSIEVIMLFFEVSSF